LPIPVAAENQNYCAVTQKSKSLSGEETPRPTGFVFFRVIAEKKATLGHWKQRLVFRRQD
jgi:hypothetical protein